MGVLSLVIVAGIYILVRRSAAGPATTSTVSPLTPERPGVQNEPSGDTQTKESTASKKSDQPLNIEQRPSTREREGPARDSGSVVFAGNGGTKVHVDDRLIGELPLNYPLRIGAGAHTVVFTHPPFEPIVRLVHVNPGREVSITADFLENAGYLRCTAKPWAEISVDDLYRDTTPIDRPIVVTAGSHHVRFHHPSFRDSVWEVSIAPRETLTVTMIFRR
jgi:hypothetical protein